MGITVYGFAQFTSYGYTGGFDKQNGTTLMISSLVVCAVCGGSGRVCVGVGGVCVRGVCREWKSCMHVRIWSECLRCPLHHSFSLPSTDIVVFGQDGNSVPNNGYTVVKPPATLYCYVDLDMYKGGSGGWVDPSGQEVPETGEVVYQERSSVGNEVLLHVRAVEGLTEGYYHCRASVAEGVERQIRVGVFVTPPGAPLCVCVCTIICTCV